MNTETLTTTLLTYLKQGPRVYAGVALTCLIVWISNIYISYLPSYFIPYLFIVGIGSLSMLIVFLDWGPAGKFIQRQLAKRHLKNLNPVEKGILKRFMDEKILTLSLHAGFDNPDISRLCERDLLEWDYRNDYRVPQWLYDYLKDHTELLKDAVTPPKPPPPGEHDWMGM